MELCCAYAVSDVLPVSCRWHYVEQQACPAQGWCVAVNMWYDMQFDSRYAAYKMVESLAQQAGLVPGGEDEGEQADSSCKSIPSPVARLGSALAFILEVRISK